MAKNSTSSKFLNFISSNWLKILIAVLVVMVSIWLYRFFFKGAGSAANGGSWLDWIGLGGDSSSKERIEEDCTDLTSSLSSARKEDIQDAADVVFEVMNEYNDFGWWSYGCQNKRGAYEQTANEYLQDIEAMTDTELLYLCNYYNASKRGNSIVANSLVQQLLNKEICFEDALQGKVLARLQNLGKCCKN